MHKFHSNRYSIFVARDLDSDDCIATSPEWPGLSGIDNQIELAIRILREAIKESIAMIHEVKEDAPTPFILSEDARLKFNKKLESLIVSS